MDWKTYDEPIDAISWHNRNTKLGRLPVGLMLKLRRVKKDGTFYERVYVVGDCTAGGVGGFECDYDKTIFGEGYYGPENPPKQTPYLTFVVAENRSFIDYVQSEAHEMQCEQGALTPEELREWFSIFWA
jgi:hypothetical protein